MQVFEPYYPIDGDLVGSTCEALYDDRHGFRIIVLPADTTDTCLRISFDAEIAYRKIDEGDFLRTFGTAIGHPVSFVYTSTDSDFLQWFRRESMSPKLATDLVDYLFLTANDCVEVLAMEPPKFMWIEANAASRW